jgi:hypothetical protein
MSPPTSEVLAPPPPPAKQLPSIPDDEIPPPIEGMGRVYFDVTGGKARVEEVLEATSSTSYGTVATARGMGTVFTHTSGERTRLLCMTPCVANLSIGDHTITIAKDGQVGGADLRVGARPSAFRYTLGRSEDSNHGLEYASIALFLLGVGSVAGGGIMLPLLEDKWPGALVGLGGVAAVAGSHVIAVNNRPVFQPGSSVHWQLPPLRF